MVNLPNPDAVRRGTHADIVDPLLLGPSQGILGPELPVHIDWHYRTLEWWQTWRGSAQAAHFLDTDWEFMLETAVIHNTFWDDYTRPSDRIRASTELRNRMAKLGSTVEDRAKLRMRSPKPGDYQAAIPTTEGVTKLADYRKRLAS